MPRAPTTTTQVAEGIRQFIDHGGVLPSGRGGRWSVVGLIRLLGYDPPENYVQYIWKNKEVLDVVNAYAIERGFAPVGMARVEAVRDGALKERHDEIAARARNGIQAAVVARAELRAVCELLAKLEQEKAILAAENEALRAQIAAFRRGFLHRVT